MTTQKKGKLGEDIAVNYLKNKNYKIIDRNYFCNVGELDIVAYKDEWVVFVEVKSISEFSDFSIFDRISNKKRRRIKRAISSWLREKKKEAITWRCDFIGVEIGLPLHKIHHYAFLDLD